MSNKVNLDPQTSGNNNIVKLTDALGNPSYFVRSFKQGAEVLIPLADVIGYIDDSTKDIKSVIPPDTTAENPLVNEKAMRELMLNTIGGRTYKTTKIGNLVWMAENLDYKFFGLDVGNTTPSATLVQANYYNNDEEYYGKDGRNYGLLYNAPAMLYLEANRETLIPGWRIPTQYEWNALCLSAGEYDNSARRNALKATDAKWPTMADGYPTNTTGFSAVPSGLFDENSDAFREVGNAWCMWTKTITASDYIIAPLINYYSAYNNERRQGYTKDQFSIRLVRDA